MDFHVTLGLRANSGNPVAEARIDQAGGRIATLGPAMNFDPQGPAVEVTVAVEADTPWGALLEAHSAVLLAFNSVEEPMTFCRGTVYTAEEFERATAVGEAK